MLIPKKQKESEQAHRKWFDKKKLKKIAKKEPSQKKLIEKVKKHVQSGVKEIVLSYVCVKCMKSYGADFLRKQIVESARRGDTYISCPKCGVALVAERVVKKNLSSKASRSILTYSRNITPEYVPNSWIDRALLEKIAHELGKFAKSVGMFNPQLKFQRGIRGKVHPNAPENVKAAEYTIEAVDNYDLRFRVVAAAGITPAGKVVLPKFFMTLGGKEVPFTREAVATFLAGKVFAPAEPKSVVPNLYYRDRDPTRFREIVASRKKKAAGTTIPGQKVVYQGKEYTVDSITGDASILTDEAGTQTAPVPNADLNIQFEEGAIPAEITAPTLAERINKLVKRSLRDEKTLVPFTDPDPDYSVAKQTEVDPDFSTPYEKSDQGILPEEERAIQRMFRGGTSVKPTKSAAEVLFDKVKSELVKAIRESKSEEDFMGMYGYPLEVGISEWLNEKGYVLSDREKKALDQFIYEEADLGRKASVKKASPAEGIPQFVYNTLMEAVEEGKTFEETEKGIEEKHPGFDFRKEDYDEAVTKVKEASIKKTAEPTGYHETDDTGKVIELSRLRTLVQDYARAGQIPLDFDLTKVMSEVSRMNRKDLLDILDKKQKGEHYPVVHAKKKTVRKKTAQDMGYEEGEFVEIDLPGSRYHGDRGQITWIHPSYDEFIIEMMGGEKIKFSGADIKKISSKKTIKSKSTNAIVREIRKADLTEEDVKKDIKDEEEGEKHYKEQAKETEDEKAKKFFEEAAEDEAGHAEDLEEVVLPAVEEERNTQNYLEKYDSRKKKAQYYDRSELSKEEIEERNALVDKVARDYYRKMKKVWLVNPEFVGFVDEKWVAEAASKLGLSLTDKEVEALLEVASEDETLWRKMRSHPFAVYLSDGSKVSPDDKEFFGQVSERLWQDPVPSEEYITPAVVRRTMQEDDYFLDYAYGKQVIQALVEPLRREWRETSQESRLDTEASLRFAQEEEEKPKTEFKELKTKPHGRPAPEEVAEAPAAAPELQKVFNEVQNHKQRLVEIKSIINEARRKTEEEIRKIQEEHKSVAEAAEMQEGIEKLSSLIEQSESQIADLGEFFIWLDTEAKTKKFRPSDKWRVQKLIEKFGEEAAAYLEKAERGAQSLNEEVQQRLLTVFPKLPKDKEGAIQKSADVFDAIKELGSGLWNYVKEISGIISEGEQLELVL